MDNTDSGIMVASGATLTITGNVTASKRTNDGTLRQEGTLNLPAEASFANNETLDLIHYGGMLPANLANGPNAKILRVGDVHTTQISRASISGMVQVTVEAFAGHTYQLQASTTLGSAANWTSVGSS